MADILIVDDDCDAAEALAEVMAFEGHYTRIACNGHEGLQRLEDRMPDLILLDIDMPGLDGPNMAYQMSVHNTGQEQIPILLVSGVPRLCAVAAQVGTPYFLSKPFVLESLLRLIERALKDRIAPVPSSVSVKR